MDFLLAQDDLPPEFSLCHAAQSAPQSARSLPPVPPMPLGRGRDTRPPSTPAPPEQRPPMQRSTQTGHAAQVGQAGQASHQASHQAGRQAERQAERWAAQRAAQANPTETGVSSPATAHAATPVPPIAPPVPSLPPEHWPRPWRERLKATRPAPVVWTYWALGEDLCGTPHAERRDLLRRLLGDLGHPAGTHTFWPSAMPAASAVGPVEISTLEAQPRVFWSGVDMLKARAVVVMGSPAVKALELPPRLRPFQQTRHNGRLVVVLRDVDFLAQESQHYDAVREFLRQALAPFGR